MKRHPTLRQLFELARDNAVRIFHDQGEVTPIWHAVPEGDGDHLLIATPWNDEDEKEMALEAIRDMFQEMRVQSYVNILEAWAVMGGDLNAISSVRPSQHPDRREVVRVTAENREGKTLSGQFYILRPEHGQATLSPFHEDPPNLITAGRMSGLLTPATGGPH
jgi:hypothetical protein